MKDFERKRQVRMIKRGVYSVPTLIILGAVLFFVFQGVWSVGQKAYDTKGASQQAQAALLDVQEREAQLEESIESLSEPFGVEAQIREKYGFIKEGEEMVIVTDDRTPPVQSTSTEEEASWWKRILDWF